MAEEIRLRAYWFVPRKPSLTIDRDAMVLRLPAWFGRHRWRIPLAEAALLPELVEGEERTSDAFFVRGIEIPYLFTTGPITEPNIGLLFREPQRVPPVRLVVAQRYLPIGWLGSRSARGEVLDGVDLRAQDPVAAREVLAAHGVGAADQPLEWLAAHREVTEDPALIEATQAQLRRATWAARTALLGYALAFALLMVGPDPLTAPWVVLLVAVLAATVAVRERVRWWHPRRQRAAG